MDNSALFPVFNEIGLALEPEAGLLKITIVVKEIYMRVGHSLRYVVPSIIGI